MVNWHAVAAVFGASAVGLGAYGAHGFKPKDPVYKEVFKNANFYQFIHGGVLVALAPHTKRPNLVGGLASVGTLLFSGACYAVALREHRDMTTRLAPVGGFLMMGAWLALALP